jgi:hypothetical protein
MGGGSEEGETPLLDLGERIKREDGGAPGSWEEVRPSITSQTRKVRSGRRFEESATGFSGVKMCAVKKEGDRERAASHFSILKPPPSEPLEAHNWRR